MVRDRHRFAPVPIVMACGELQPVSRARRRARVAVSRILARSRCDHEARVALVKGRCLEGRILRATADQADKRERRSIGSPPALPRSLRAVNARSREAVKQGRTIRAHEERAWGVPPPKRQTVGLCCPTSASCLRPRGGLLILCCPTSCLYFPLPASTSYRRSYNGHRAS